MKDLRVLAKAGNVTLLFGARDEKNNQVAVLAELLNKKRRKAGRKKSRRPSEI